MKITRFILDNTALVTLLFAAHTAWPQGALTPPGVPAPTMKTLDQVEPRKLISALPYTINQPGSYYLTTNLTGDARGGITVAANGVTLDLMGFEVVGGSGSGITASAYLTNICVRDGTIRGWSSAGVDLENSTSCQFTKLRLLDNGGAGLFAGHHAGVDHCVAVNNPLGGIIVYEGGEVAACALVNCGCSAGEKSAVRRCNLVNSGISVGASCVVEHCVVTDSSTDGISCGDHTKVNDCAVYNSFLIGIHAGYVAEYDGCSISSCIVQNCRSDGIRVGNACIITGCNVRTNGTSGGNGISTGIRCTVRDCTAVENRNDGISVGGDSTVLDCHASKNGSGSSDAGIYTLGTGSRVENNSARDNNGWGIKATTGDIMVRNSAGGNSSGNYSPSSGANFGPLQSPNTATSPWANFAF